MYYIFMSLVVLSVKCYKYNSMTWLSKRRGTLLKTHNFIIIIKKWYDYTNLRRL